MSDGPTPAAPRRDLLERSLVTIRELRARLEAGGLRPAEPIAIIGLACRFPGGAATPDAFWDLLCSGGDAIGPVPAGRWPEASAAERAGIAGGFLREDVAGFDAHFFSVSPREAGEMDPQHRLLLETSWEALERAAVDPHALRGSRTGMFVGISGSEYGMLPRAPDDLSPYTATGLTANLASGRLAYFFGANGPAVSVDTACSSSLVAVHLACRSLQAGDCDCALAAGVNALLAAAPFQALRRLGALAADGRCKTFSAAADGYGRGEGCGVVVLKRLAQARADGDRIWAVIRGSAVNQDGASSGLTVPNGLAQQALQRAALAAAGVTAADLDLVELHGTGTALGDPIEVQALREVHRGRGSRPLFLGAVKSVLGHLEAAAGIAGLIKVVLSLQRGAIPPQRVAGAVNPRLDLASLPAVLPAQAQPWEPAGRPRLAGVSAFGFSGTNAHVILAEAPEAGRADRTAPPPPAWLKVTADTDAALRALAARYREALTAAPDLAAFCWTANAGRASLPRRIAVAVRHRAALAEALDTWARGGRHPDVVTEGEPAGETAGWRAEAADFVAGEGVDWRARAASVAPGCHADVPTYPFQRRRHWLPAGTAGSGEVMARRIDSAAREQVCEFTLSRDNLPDLGDNQGVLHVGHYQALVAAALGREPVRNDLRWEETEFLFLLRIPPDGAARVQVVSERRDDGRRSFRVCSQPAPGGEWVLHVRGVFSEGAFDAAAEAPARTAVVERWDADRFYARMAGQGFGLGPAVKLLREVELGADGASGIIAAPPAPGWAPLPVAPAVFDVCGQLLLAAGAPHLGIRTTFMVARWERLVVFGGGPRGGDLRCRMTLRPAPADPRPGRLTADYRLETPAGAPVAEARGVEFQLLAGERLAELQRAVAASEAARGSARAGTTAVGEAEVGAAIAAAASAVLRIPAAELDRSEPLRRLGLDSITGLEIRAQVERALGVAISAEHFIVGPSIDELARLVADRGGVLPSPPVTSRRAGGWLVCELPRPAARVRLFCVPSGALGASQYAGWGERLPATVEVCALQLPGREERFGEAPFEDLEALVTAIESALAGELDRPYAFYGHSLGALVAYRTAHRLWRRAPQKPIHLFPGAFTCPLLPNPVVAKYRRRFQAAGLPGIPGPRDRSGHAVAARFVREGLASTTALNTEELAGALLPTMLADMKLVSDYVHDPEEPPFDVPITVFHGAGDADVTREECERWRDLTTADFDCRVLPGDHFFMHRDQARDALVAAIGGLLAPAAAGDGAGEPATRLSPHPQSP